jgi:predicted CXXCH cytochrome family protein
MTPKQRAVRIAALVVGLVAAAFGVWFAWKAREAPVAPTQNVPVTYAEARNAPMHVVHVGTEKIACTECHAEDFAKKPDASSCGRCHAKEQAKPHLPATANACLNCHAFSPRVRPPVCVDCHVAGADPNAKKVAHHARADVACTSCHSPHAPDKGRLADCTGCHEGVSAVHGSVAVAAQSDTDAAGADPHALRDASAAVLAFAKGTAKTASAGQVCAACHAPHMEKQAAQVTCASTACHAPMATAVHAGGHETCTTCHEPHRAKKTDVKSCDGCHGDRRGAFAIKAHEKASCTTCHAPHAAGSEQASAACATCHSTTVALAATKVKAHAACASCHDVHQPNASATSACAKCHSTVAPAHPVAKNGSACTGCHEPHPKKPDVIATACSSCHTKAKTDHAFHAAQTECSACHAPHGFALAKTATTGAAGGAFCAKCHASQGAAVAARSGHAECRACHGEPHSPTKKPACHSCHAQESATAPKGHAVCASCHDSHSGSLGSHAACASCHADKPKALHGNQDCKTCHRPHGPSGLAQPPSCTSCHTKLPGAHATPAHAARCGSCHAPHAPPRADRATCTSSCHLDRRNHQAEAKLCTGCHVFRD